MDSGPGNVPEQIPAPDEFLLSFPVDYVARVAKKARVEAGDELARAQHRVLSIHAPCAGTITDIGPGFIRMARLEDDADAALQSGSAACASPDAGTSSQTADARAAGEEPAAGVRPKSETADMSCQDGACTESGAESASVSSTLLNLEGAALVDALGLLGVDARHLTSIVNTVVVNALNPEPGMVWVGSLLTHCTKALRVGLAALQRLSPARNWHFVTAHAVDSLFAGAQEGLCAYTVTRVKPKYPASLNTLAIKAATGQELPEGVLAVGLHEVFAIGSVLLRNAPLTETIVDVGGRTYRALIGTPVRHILEYCGQAPAHGDVVALNGLFRGRAISDAGQGIGGGDMALAVVREGTYMPVSDAPCIGCGRCIEACPARLSPDMISRYAEFGIFDICRRKYHVEVCMECGLCGFVCVARRPVLQYVRLAKQESASLEVQS